MKRKGLLLTIVLFCSLFMGCQLATTTTLSTPPTTSSITQTTTQSTTSQATITTINSRRELIRANLSTWGLGTSLVAYQSNERDYAWYVNQFTTGTHGSVNCGPTSVEMAGRWSRSGFDHTAQEARSLFRAQGGWWYDSDIAGALDAFDIDYVVSYLSSADDLIDAIDAGRIVLINNDMSKIPYNDNVESHVNRFYTGVTGHYLLVKGYLITDTFTYFEVYDPFNGSSYYADASPRGLNRFYESEALVQSILQWYTKVYEITPTVPTQPA